MKNKKITIALLSLMLVVSLIGCSAPVAPVEAPRTIDVSLTSTKLVAPDMVVLDALAEATHPTAEEAQLAANTISNKALESLKALGIEEKDIMTTNVTLHEVFDYSKDGKKSLGQKAQVNINVKIRDIAKYSEVLSVLSDAGMTNFGNSRYDLSNRDEIYEQMLAEAIPALKNKAEKMLKSVNESVDKVLTISEQQVSQGYYPRMNSMAYDKSVEVSGQDLNISVGEIEVNATVYATFKIK